MQKAKMDHSVANHEGANHAQKTVHIVVAFRALRPLSFVLLVTLTLMLFKLLDWLVGGVGTWLRNFGGILCRG